MQPNKYNPNFHTGKFRHRISFQKLGTTQDDLGQDVEGKWETVASAWAMIKTLQGREYYAAASAQSERTSRFVIPYQRGIDSTMRIVYDNRIFDIEQPPINDDEMNKTLTIIVREVNPNDKHQQRDE